MDMAYEHLRRHYEMILHAAGEGICGLDLDGQITFVNPTALRMLGYELHELLGQDLAALAERPVTGSNGQVRRALAADTTFRSHDQLFWRKDGTCFPIEYTSTPNGSPSGRARRQALVSTGSVASINRASLASLAFSAVRARLRPAGLVLVAIDPSYAL